MSRWMTIAVAATVAGCAGAQVNGNHDASGHWIGEIERDGRRQAVALEIEREGGSYRGQLRPVDETGKSGVAAPNAADDEVRFETEQLRFVGHVDGSRLSGRVTDKVADAPIGELSAVHAQEAAPYSSASEWSAPPDAF
jgi:hypothetical protein